MNKQVLFKSLLLIGFLIASMPVQSGETRMSSNVLSDPRINELKLKSGGTQLGVKLDTHQPERGKQLNSAGTQLGGN